jgi:hypothetical protein
MSKEVVQLVDSVPPQAQRRMGQSNMVRSRNYTDADGNPAGGYAHGPGMCIAWQDGPRGTHPDGAMKPANGAFVEDALVAAYQRLESFQQSKYVHLANTQAMSLIAEAIAILHARAQERQARGVLGQNAV